MSEDKAKEKLNVLEHLYVPRHEVLTEEEVKAVLKRFNVKSEQLPYILESDPVVKAIGAKPGDVVKIIRKSETAGETVFYRFVVEG